MRRFEQEVTEETENALIALSPFALFASVQMVLLSSMATILVLRVKGVPHSGHLRGVAGC